MLEYENRDPERYKSRFMIKVRAFCLVSDGFYAEWILWPETLGSDITIVMVWVMVTIYQGINLNLCKKRLSWNGENVNENDPLRMLDFSVLQFLRLTVLLKY